MAETKTERKVTVILAADVVGYSTMMEANEEQTLKNLTACRTIVDSLIEAHHGRIFNTAGDSVLTEFPSAVEASVPESSRTRSGSATIPLKKPSGWSSEWESTWGMSWSRARTCWARG